MKEIIADNEEDKSPRGAVKFMAQAALMALPSLKNPGRARGAKLEIEKAVKQLEDELTRLYGIERTARVLVADYAAHPRDAAAGEGGKEEAEAFTGLNEALSVPVPQ